MSYLHLADNGDGVYRYQTRGAMGIDPGLLDEYYLPVPDGNGSLIYVREDLFDHLSPGEFEVLQNYLSDCFPEHLGLFGWGKKNKAKRQARRAARQEKKAQKQAMRMRKKEAKTARQEAKTAAIQRGEPVGLQKLVGTVMGGLNPQLGPDEPDMPMETRSTPILGGLITGSGEIGINEPFYKKPWFIIGTVAVLGSALLYVATRKKAA